ncbi:ATP-binding protein [Streptosporangium canum]|uniref:ATP-binding protein n=1 Tax=Streptosporangium canum TaxID=324952 RepID=UPI000A836D27|nr:ATP-binding protein [Streptosporangium canum]
MTIGETRKNERSQAQAAIPQDKQVRAPDGWTKTFTDPRLCAALVDRITFAGNIIETGTDSYRLAQTRARSDANAS